MEARRRSLCRFTVVLLAVYAPLETWYSLPALWDPFYLVDLIGILTLAAAVMRLRRGASQPAAALLAAGYGWLGANAWRAFFDRIEVILAGGTARLGAAEMIFIGVGIPLFVSGAIRSIMIVAAGEKASATADTQAA